MIHPRTLTSLIVLASGAASATTGTYITNTTAPTVHDTAKNVKYVGLNRNGIEVFLNIPFGQDTSGANRFKPPRPYKPEPGSTIIAQAYGPACPQALSDGVPPLALTGVTEVSEDCLNLNVARPVGVSAGEERKGLLPVLVWIYGGGFLSGENNELTTAPDGLVLQSVENGTPVVHVAMNYRLGFFGFAQSDALKEEGSENAGLRDQRLAIEWVRDNIAHFGGDPERITIFGQSSGGLAVGIQTLAYGGSQPVPFQQAICESQALEPGITANYSIDAMAAVVNAVGCNTTLHSAETIACLRSLDGNLLLNASLETYIGDVAHNIGDIWLPVVDGDFLPAPPSELLATGRFANVTTMIGWSQDDLTLYTDPAISTPNDTRAFVESYIPSLSPSLVDTLLSLYPSTDFAPTANHTAEFYRTARIWRDILMVCQPVHFGSVLAAAGNDVFLYNWNQTFLGPALAAARGLVDVGVPHTAEFAYVFGNLSHYDISSDIPFTPSESDYALERRASRSWAVFASTGRPGGEEGMDTFRGFETGFDTDGRLERVFVVGGPNEGMSEIDGEEARPAVREQRLRERCQFINSQEMVEALRY